MSLGRRVGMILLLFFAMLDFAVPTSPSVFVVEADESVDSMHMNRHRVFGDLVPTPELLPSSRLHMTTVRPVADSIGRSPRVIASQATRVISWMPRAALVPRPESTDPQ